MSSAGPPENVFDRLEEPSPSAERLAKIPMEPRKSTRDDDANTDNATVDPLENAREMSNGDLNWIANYIWGIADDVLRDLYVRGKYRDVILPMTVLRRLDAVLEGGKKGMRAAFEHTMGLTGCSVMPP